MTICVVTQNDDQEPHVRLQVDVVPICDPLFLPADADIALRSLEGTIYRLRTWTLRSNSGFFDTMFSLPQNEVQHGIHDGDSVVLTRKSEMMLDIYENDFPLKTLLSLMSGIPVLEWETIDAFECVLWLAEKWDAPGPIGSLRSALAAHKIIESYPLRCYRLATHFGWRKEAKLASYHSLMLGVFDPIYRDTLAPLSSKDLLSLFDLHRRRQVMFRELLHCPERFVAGNSSSNYCQHCGITPLGNAAWRVFRNRMCLEMEKRPMGDSLGIGSVGWLEAQACWDAKCPNENCGARNYDRVVTLRQIEACIALLPKTVEYGD